ncbi:resolvase [Amycolatopsis balhimycina DSM 5908]|uniref:Resolvase n=1 Tax=Amycolatopsis balhimycina DSM 5908 TaxID=1081091 RepID=A0A428X0A5_AMYBA|nr:resolvase [Amycolatopsis balhimycina DSM 5908]
MGPLVSVLKRVREPAEDGHEKVTTIEDRTASSGYIRHALTDGQVGEVIAAYRSGETAKKLAERYDVHINTIKKKLHKHGVRRH